MKINTCKECRRAMRLWALDWRRVATDELKYLCLRVALDFRSGTCYHATTYDRPSCNGPTPSDFARHLANTLSRCFLRTLADLPPSHDRVGVVLSSTLPAIGVGKAQIESGLQAPARSALEYIRESRHLSGGQILPPIPGEFGERSDRIAAVRANQAHAGALVKNPYSRSSADSKTKTGGAQ